MKARPEVITGVLLLCAFGIGMIQSRNFLDLPYLLDTTSLYVETGLVALGVTLVIVSGNIDLSVGAQVALVACAVALLLQLGIPAPIALGLGPALGLFLGAVNGTLIAWLRLPSVVVTLATMALYRGLAQALLAAKSVPIPESVTGFDRIYIAGFPAPLLLLLVAAGIAAFVLHKTVLGRWIYVVGTNERAGFFGGVPTARVKLTVFALTGLLAGIAGVLIASRLGVARFDHARGLELDAITAVVLGGASIFGGSGSIFGTMLALALIAVVRTAMGLANVKAEYQLAIVGTLLIAAIVTQNVVAASSTKRFTKPPA